MITIFFATVAHIARDGRATGGAVIFLNQVDYSYDFCLSNLLDPMICISVIPLPQSMHNSTLLRSPSCVLRWVIIP